MANFGSRPINPSQIQLTLRKHPFAMFGLPFLGTMVLAAWGLGKLTQTRYDLRDEKVFAVTREEELGMKKGRRKFDVREEYFRLQATGNQLGGISEDWENKRVDRLPGQADWGELPIAKK